MAKSFFDSLENILNNEKNIDIEFVIHIKNKQELISFAECMQKHDFCVELNLFDESLCDFICNLAKEDNYDTCFRLKNHSDFKCVACNPSIEHWRLYCQNIIEFQDGEFIFHDGFYTRKSAEIEAEKIVACIAEGDYLAKVYGDRNVSQIIECLLKNNQNT